MQNNPIRFTDPSGHKRVEDMDGGGPCNIMNCSTMTIENDKGGGGNCDTNGSHYANIPCPGLRTRDFDDWNERSNGSDALCPVSSIVECYYRHASLDMGQELLYLDYQEFEDFLLAIYYEVHGRNRFDLISSSLTFDTPFYDLGSLKGPLPGDACLGESCYARHEINYVAQGEISAAAGESLVEGLGRVFLWKGTKIKLPSKGTLEMFLIGYSYYHDQNNSTPPMFPLFLPPLIPLTE